MYLYSYKIQKSKKKKTTPKLKTIVYVSSDRRRMPAAVFNACETLCSASGDSSFCCALEYGGVGCSGVRRIFNNSKQINKIKYKQPPKKHRTEDVTFLARTKGSDSRIMLRVEFYKP